MRPYLTFTPLQFQTEPVPSAAETPVPQHDDQNQIPDLLA
jgi:hypothetical protein